MKNSKLFSSKKKFAVVTTVCSLVLTTVVCFCFWVTGNSRSKPLADLLADYIIDMDNPSAVAGFADFVFVGRVKRKNQTEYRNVSERETEYGGSKTIGAPYTNYDIIVLKNLKGTLKTDETIPFLKDGGVSLDGQYLVLEKKDFLPEEGDVCVFCVSVQDDGRLLIIGKSGNIKIMESKLAGKATQQITSDQIRQISQDEWKAVVKSSVYQTMAKACENEVPFERERNEAPAEFLESSAP